MLEAFVKSILTQAGNLLILSHSQMKVLDYGLIAVAEELQQIAFTALNGSESNDTPQEVQLEETCIATLDKHVKKVLHGIDKKEALRKSVAKNVTNCRHRIIKEFMRSHMVNKRRYCPGCKAPSRDVRSEYNSRVFLKALSAREANKWVKTQVLHAHLQKHSAGNDDGPQSEGKNYKTVISTDLCESLAITS